MKRFAFVFTLIVVASGATRAHAQDIERVRALYVAAAYEEALAAIPASAPAAVRLEVEQYRALCLLALGREGEAVAAVEGIVGDHPTYRPPDAETSPRMQALFAAARLKLLPGLVRQAYGAGKAALEAQNAVEARAAFERAIAIVDSVPPEERGELADLRLLASEFLALGAARAAATPPPVEKPETSAPPAQEYVGPVTVSEPLPAWTPPDSAARRNEFLGVLRVFIGPDGRVQSTEIVKSSHPAYDAAVTRAARQWLYKPATRGGQPVASQKDIQIRLMPQ
jgi:protein TonB